MTEWVNDENLGLFTDFYELTMAQAYFSANQMEPASFELFVRSLPDSRRFLVAAGLDSLLSGMQSFAFDARSVDYLASLERFDDAFLQWLSDVQFQGDVWAVPEGEVVFGNEPILRVTAPLPIAQLLETLAINVVGHQTMVASKAARVAIACGDRRFVDFAARRAHGVDAALKGARAAYLGGAAATSMSLAGRLYGIPVTGTMAHSYVMSFDTEAEAFRTFAVQFPDDAVLLIDTYDTENGARIAAELATELADQNVRVRGVRLDSGDLVRLSRSVRDILDNAGHEAIQIFASGDLDEYKIAEVVGQSSPIDAFGVGTRLGTSADAPSLEIVYKLVADASGPTMKLSEGKATLPGAKQVWRFEDYDLIGLADESHTGRPLLEPFVLAGQPNREPASLDDSRLRRHEAVAALPARLRSLTGREDPWTVAISDTLQELVDQRAAAVTGM